MNTIDQTTLLEKTNYFSTPKTWILRALKFMMALFVLYLVDLSELPNVGTLLPICAALLAIGFTVVPVQELAYSNTQVYFINHSILPIFNSVRSYDVADVKRIGWYSRNPPINVFSLFVPTTNLYRIELTFKDGSSKSEDWFINKKELQHITAGLRNIIF